MSFAAVLAAMPDLLARALSEHVPDDRGRCRECRDDDGTSAPWPCAMRLIADEARGMTAGPAGGAAPSQAAPRPVLHPVPVPVMAPVTAPAPIIDTVVDPVFTDGPVTAPQPPISDGWDPLADRRAFRRERYQH